MKILITNDDGIYSPGIVPLVEWAKKLGEVTVIAPKTEQSGKSHAIDFVNPVEIKRVDIFPGVEAYSMDSTPADCVRFGIGGLKRSYDLVLSGINRGVNLGIDIIYSGTVAAVFEAAYWKHNAIALSTYPDTLDEAAASLDGVYSFLSENRLFERWQTYNVNIPKKPRGVRITKQGSPYFDDGFIVVDEARSLYLQTGNKIPDECPEDSERDTVTVEAGYISVTPVTVSRTDMDAYSELKHIGEDY